MQYPEPYKLADETIVMLGKLEVRYFEIVKQRLIMAGFDEMNVIREVSGLYSQIDRVARRNIRAVWILFFTEWWVCLKGEKPDEDMIDSIVDMELAGLFGEPNPTTKYTYESEILRKQQRTIEAVLAVNGSVNKQIELDKALKSLSGQIKEYVDLAVDNAALNAMSKAGIEQVMWCSENDNRVCNDCEDLNGQVFDIDKVPDKPHPNCRCWKIPVLVAP